MSTHNEQKIVFPENCLESFVYLTEQINKKYLEGSCDDEVLNRVFFDNIRFEGDLDSIHRLKLVKDIDDELELYFQLFLLGHAVHPENWEKNNGFSIYDSPEENLKKFNSIKPKLKSAQWPCTQMKRNQGTSGVANWLFKYGPEFCKKSLPLMDGNKSFKELLDESQKIMGFKDTFHLTRVLKDLSVIKPNLVNNKGEVYCGTYSKFAFTKGFKGQTQTHLLNSHPRLVELLGLPLNVEHNLCNWIKWMMHTQNIK